MPYVPEEVRRLPDDWRAKGREYAGFNTDYNAGRAHMAFSIADRIESALASAPADGYKMVPFGPTQEMVDSGMRWLSATDGRHVVEGIWKDMYTTYLARSNHD